MTRLSRLSILLVVTVFLAGCLATRQPGPAKLEVKTETDAFRIAVQKLEQSGNPSGLKTLADKEPGSARGKNARSILNVYKSQTRTIDKLRKTNKELKKENRKLKVTLEKLNRINLEMEKRTD